jgi:hypothetical protein
MTTRLVPLGLAPALLLTAAAHAASGAYDLEPCINGGVSATGRYATQAEEDRQLAPRQALELEPCINGAVSARGLFPSQAAEDQWRARMVGT